MGEATRKRARDGKKGRAEVKGECRGRSGHPESPPARQKASGEPAMKARPPRPSERKLHLKEPTKEKRDKKRRRRRRRRRRPRPRCRGGRGEKLGWAVEVAAKDTAGRLSATTIHLRQTKGNPKASSSFTFPLSKDASLDRREREKEFWEIYINKWRNGCTSVNIFERWRT